MWWKTRLQVTGREDALDNIACTQELPGAAVEPVEPVETGGPLKCFGLRWLLVHILSKIQRKMKNVTLQE